MNDNAFPIVYVPDAYERYLMENSTQYEYRNINFTEDTEDKQKEVR